MFEKIFHESSDGERDHEKNVDVQVGAVYDGEEPVDFAEKKDLRRGLHQRHIQMIALAGTIGTGLFLSSGKALAQAGPLGAWLGYTFVGMLVTAPVFSIAEMSALVPLSGGVIRHAEYFVDPALAFAEGWNSIYSYMVSLPAEIVAAAVVTEFWVHINNGIWITVFGILLVLSNIILVRIYGELEFIFATLKILLVVGVNIMALVVTCGGGPDHHTYGFQYWRNPGPFVQYLGINGDLGRFLGFWTVFSNAVYAYSGVQNISTAAAETESPRRNIPMAAKRIFWRVGIFYSLSIFMIGMIVPSNDENLLQSSGTAAQSPFVIAATRAGIKVVPSIINAVVLTSAWSAGNAGLLNSSRILYGLAQDGRAPKFFKRTSRLGIPWASVAFMSLFVCLGYMSLQDSASTVFSWLQDLVSVAALIDWMVICGVYLRFYYAMKKQGISRERLPWKGMFQPYLAWIGLVAFALLLLTGGYTTFIHGHWSTETFVSSYINIPIILTLYFGYKLIRKTRIVPLMEVPIMKYLDIYDQNPEPPLPPVIGWRRFNILWS
ncbi:proline-specific permease [Lecanosticta acicola]|uniref:Proline-specific permease n=1 Tax=Lecanosticta acicola TaxID=111012 RepID=A0AAI8YVQ4_9PEZI|nr:proline-specific permease [Lecanosticta acicola]